MTQQELIKQYLAYKEAERNAKESANQTLKELEKLAPHKKGEIIKWNELTQTGVLEKKAVLRHVAAWMVSSDNEGSVSYRYDFSPIKKDGFASLNYIRPGAGYKWTGEILDNF